MPVSTGINNVSSKSLSMVLCNLVFSHPFPAENYAFNMNAQLQVKPALPEKTSLGLHLYQVLQMCINLKAL